MILFVEAKQGATSYSYFYEVTATYTRLGHPWHPTSQFSWFILWDEETDL